MTAGGECVPSAARSHWHQTLRRLRMKRKQRIGSQFARRFLSAAWLLTAAGGVLGQPVDQSPVEVAFGPPPYEPVLRDDEVVVLGWDGAAQRAGIATQYNMNGSGNHLITRGGPAD